MEACFGWCTKFGGKGPEVLVIFLGDQCRSSPLPVPANTRHNLGFMLGTQQPFIHRITNTWAKRTLTSSWTRSGPALSHFGDLNVEQVSLSPLCYTNGAEHGAVPSQLSSWTQLPPLAG